MTAFDSFSHQKNTVFFPWLLASLVERTAPTPPASKAAAGSSSTTSVANNLIYSRLKYYHRSEIVLLARLHMAPARAAASLPHASQPAAFSMTIALCGLNKRLSAINVQGSSKIVLLAAADALPGEDPTCAAGTFFFVLKRLD